MTARARPVPSSRIRLGVEQLIFDHKDVQVRVRGTDKRHLEDLRRLPDEELILDVTPDGPYFIVLSQHRGQIAREKDMSVVTCDVYPQTDDGDVRQLAYDTNLAHGLKLSPADKAQRAREVLLAHPHWSDPMIAARVGVSDKTIAAARRRMGANSEIPKSEKRVGGDGRTVSVAGNRRGPKSDPVASAAKAAVRGLVKMIEGMPEGVSDDRATAIAGESLFVAAQELFESEYVGEIIDLFADWFDEASSWEIAQEPEEATS
jgi:hypothetical protein